MYGPVPPPGVRPGLTAPGALAWGARGSATIGVGRDDLVSGEAVALELPPAAFGLRVLSGLIDVIVGVLLLLGSEWLADRAVTGDSALRDAVGTLSLVLVLVGFPTICETVSHGKTLGHLVVGTRTVRDDGGPVGFRQSLTRALLSVVEFYGCLGIPAMLAVAVSRKGKRFGDMLAGTYVIRDRRSLPEPVPIEMPAGLAPWAESADIAPLPDRLAINVRQFMIRRYDMKDDPRARAANGLLFAVAPFVAPPPPPAPPEAVLAAIMAERRRRDTAKIERDERLRARLLGDPYRG